MTPVRSFVESLEARIAPAAATLNLAALNGNKGFEISGAAADDYSGSSISGAGDINGDGIGDLLIGAPEADPAGADSGAAYVVFGGAGRSGVDLSLSSLNGTNGFTIHGEKEGDEFGYSVSAAGDVNGDGVGDLLIGAPQADANGAASGAAYVIFGRTGGFSPTLSLSALDGTNGFKINGAAEADHAGGSVSGGGDINGDGFGDVVIGAAGSDAGGADSGSTYVVFGRASGNAPAVELASLDGVNGFRISGEAGGDGSGTSVSGAGDVNRDGFGDVIIGAPGAKANGIGAGAGYVVLGHAGPFAPEFSLAALDGSTGFKINGESEDDSLGASVSGAGDVNGDGFADLIVGAPGVSGNVDYAGASYVIFGRAASFGPALDVATLNGSTGFKILGEEANDYAGASVSGAGDVNGDGFSDLIIGAYGSDARNEYAGAAYVVFGQASGFTASLRLASLNGDNGFQINGAREGDYAGTSVAGAGDINGDGVDDLLVGAPSASSNGAYSGSTYVVFGRGGPKPDPTTFTVTEPDGDVLVFKSTKGVLSKDDIVFGPNGEIEMIDLTHLAGALQAKGGKAINLSISVKGGSGDGFANIGYINGTGVALGKIQIAGSLGRIDAGNGFGQAAIKSLSVKGDLGAVGGSPQLSHLVGAMTKLFIGGSLQHNSMQVDGVVKVLTIAGNLSGGGGMSAASLAAISELGIEGYVARGNATPAGVMAAEAMGKVKIGGSISGGSMVASKDLGKVTLAGSFSAGGIFSGGNVKSVTVRGQMGTDDIAAPASMTARNGFAKLMINGDVKNAEILAGYTKDGEPVNADARIGKVVVNGSWIRSSLVAGVADSTEDGFGRNDTVISGDTTPAILSKIANIVIKGHAEGSATEGDHFGIVAQQIGKLSIGGRSIDVKSAPAEGVLLDEVNGDFRVVALG